MMSLSLLLLISAFVLTLLAAINKAPLWVAVLLLTLAELLRALPL